MNVKTYKKLAALAVQVGVNLQKGQDVVLYISTSQAEFAKYITAQCYKQGARKVVVEWKNTDIQKLHYRHQGIKPLCRLEPWEIEKERYRSSTLPCLIHVMDDDPDAYASIDVTKMTRSMLARKKAIKPYRDIADNQNQWTIIAVPSKEWAKKVFPEETIPNAQKKLWKAILHCMHADVADPVKEWKKHIAMLEERAQKLNALNLDTLVYSSANGTSLRLKLHPDHVWLSARDINLRGISFAANMPTEEVFTMPSKQGVDGVVVATKPLSYNGVLIEGIRMHFEKGRIVKVEASKGQEFLEKLVNSDEGSHYLGEVALVPYDSPINQCGCLFYETLFDENASCHLAFGQAYKNTMKNYEHLSDDDFKAKDYNDSMMHIDFMIGSEDLSIVGINKDGKETPVFSKGRWAI